MATILMDGYATIQAALDDNTYDAVNGDTFVFPDGWSSTETGQLDVATYGKPLVPGASTPPVYFQRESDSATVNVNHDVVGLFAFNKFGGGFICDGIRFNTTASGSITYTTSTENNYPAIFRRCAFISDTRVGAYAYYGRSNVVLSECYFKNLGSVLRFYGWLVDGCLFDNCGFYNSGSYGSIMNSLFINGSKIDILGGVGSDVSIRNNTLIGDGSGTAIRAPYGTIRNNLIVDYTDAIGGYFTYDHSMRIIGNRGYNITSMIKSGTNPAYQTDNEILTSDPFPTEGVYVPDMDPIQEYVGFDPTKISKSAYAGAWPLAGGGGFYNPFCTPQVKM